MKSSRRYVSILAVLFAISVSLAFVSGCSQNAVAPGQDDQNQAELDLLSSDITTGQADRDRLRSQEETVSGLIGPNGGVLLVRFDASTPTIFRFPQGALTAETMITICAHIEESPSGSLAVYECGPAGIVFEVPVEVTQPMPPDRTTASLYYFNENSVRWELQEMSRITNGVALLHIYHFSKYGIGSSQAPIDLGLDDGNDSQ
jgi:outer membrane murein-binding lipoprotein Lpp